MVKTILKRKPDRWNPRTNGKSKPLETKSKKEAYTYTLTKREKGGKKGVCIYLSIYLYIYKGEHNQINKQIYL